MIVYYTWLREKKIEDVPCIFTCDGWFLFGILPLYLRIRGAAEGWRKP